MRDAQVAAVGNGACRESQTQAIYSLFLSPRLTMRGSTGYRASMWWN
jgi:hypothetical protein